MKQAEFSSPSEILPAGTPAPDFELGSSKLSKMKLADFRGKPLIIFFYPADFSPVCGDQVALYNEVFPEFEEYGAQIIGMSVDGRWCHAEYAKQKKLRFPLLSDFEPKGAVARSYGAYYEVDGTAARALFVIDAEGIIRWSYLSHIDINPGADGILNALETMRAKPGTNSAVDSAVAGDADAKA